MVFGSAAASRDVVPASRGAATVGGASAERIDGNGSGHAAVGGRLRVAEILDAPDGGSSLVGSTVTVCGWVRTVRAQKDFTFVKVNDGSTHRELQAVLLPGLPGFEAASAQGAGAALRLRGEVVESKGRGQAVELSCALPHHEARVLGGSEAKAYPLAKKKHNPEFLRSIAHLRPRTNLIGAVARMRNTLAAATHNFFQDRGFLYVQTPIITTVDCEGAGEMFRVTNGDMVEGAGASKEAKSKEFFGRPAYLTVSGQLAVENYCCALGDVYTFGPTFRAEMSHTTRHLAEFWMIEPELAFADLTDAMDCAEAFLRHCAAAVLERSMSDVEFFAARVDQELPGRLEQLAGGSFERVPYTEAVEVLRAAVVAGDASFKHEVVWGKELQTEHEKYLTEKVYLRPTFIFDFPKDCKAFYMRANDDGRTVAAMDLLCPGLGELIGGSQREERLDILDHRMAEHGLKQDDYWWYRDLRRYGSVPHAGFGVGFERLVMLCTGVPNIRDVIPFPRFPGHADF